MCNNVPVQQYVCTQSLKAVCARTCAQLRGSTGYHSQETPPNQGRSQGEAGRASAPQNFALPTLK